MVVTGGAFDLSLHRTYTKLLPLGKFHNPIQGIMIRSMKSTKESTLTEPHDIQS